MITESVTGVSGDAGWITWTPEPAILKVIMSAPWLAFAFRIAWRSVFAPESAVEVTKKTDGSRRPSSSSSAGRQRAGQGRLAVRRPLGRGCGRRLPVGLDFQDDNKDRNRIVVSLRKPVCDRMPVAWDGFQIRPTGS